MDKAMIQALARRAGLDRTLADFPDDVAAAATAAKTAVGKLVPPEDPASEPWPPMRVGGQR
jgi:hypothetical protein